MEALLHLEEQVYTELTNSHRTFTIYLYLMSIIKVLNFHCNQVSACQDTQYLNTHQHFFAIAIEDEIKLDEQKTVDQDLW